MGIGKKLERWRRAHGLKQRAAAAQAGISQAAWQALETDRVKRVGLEIAQAIVEVTEGEITLADFVPKKRPRTAHAPQRTGTHG